jgi:hypothetical protein
MNVFLRLRLVLCVAFLGVSTVIPGLTQERTVRVGTVLDGATDPDIAFRVSVQTEVTRLLSGRYNVRFPPQKQLVGN